jgi:peptide/nickel transport system substrate-binding protein/oligopeptide transport system substrate-binding protein
MIPIFISEGGEKMRGNKKLQLGLLPSLFCILALLLSACGETGNASTEKADENHQVLVSSEAGAGLPDLPSFDPASAADLFSGRATSAVFTGLVSLDNSGKVQTQMASWKISDDGLTYTFTLKDGLTFSNGRALKAADVAYSINRAIDPATQSPVALAYLSMIKDSEMLGHGIQTLVGDSLIVQDDKTLQIKLNRPVGYFLSTLSLPIAYTVNSDLVNTYGPNWTDHLNEGAGAGPFKVKSYQRGAKEIVLQRNDKYYGPKPQLQEIHFPFYQKRDATRDDYLTNKLDDARIPLEFYPNDKKRNDYYQYNSLSTSYYAFNMRIKPFDNLKIRQAFALALNKDELSNKIWKGSFIPTNHIIPQGMPGYNPDLTGPDGTKSTSGNPDKAKQLLKDGLQEEGYQSVSDIPPIKLTYASGGNQAIKDEVSLLEQDWKDVLGITVTDADVDFKTLAGYTRSGDKNTLQFFAGPAWGADYPDPQDWTTLLFSQNAPKNSMHFGTNSSPENAAQAQLQADMLAADTMPNNDARLKAYQRIEQELVNQVAWLPTQQQLFYGLRKPCVQGTPKPATGIIPPDEWSKVYISKASDCVNKTVS